VSGFFHDVARASLPVAIGLLVLTAVARGLLESQLEHVRARAVARQYLAPLSTWCLIAIATYTVALLAAGDAGALSLALALAIGAAALLLRSPDEAPREAEAAPAEREPRPAAPAPAPAGSLWGAALDDEPARRGGLWSRS
jgi:hypothetical protein